METTQRIRNLIYAYSEAVDEGNFEAVGALFSRGSLTFSPGGRVLHGASEITEFYKYAIRIDPETGTPRTVHRVYNVHILQNGDEWQSRARYEVLLCPEQAEPRLIAVGRYFDSFRVDQDECFFRARKVLNEFLDDAGEHIDADLIRFPRMGHEAMSIVR